jgi:hypothetical protein
MAAKLTRLTHKIAIQQHLVAESCTICSSRSRRPVRKLLDTPQYIGPRCSTSSYSILALTPNNSVYARALIHVFHVASLNRNPMLTFVCVPSSRPAHITGLFALLSLSAIEISHSSAAQCTGFTNKWCCTLWLLCYTRNIIICYSLIKSNLLHRR